MPAVIPAIISWAAGAAFTAGYAMTAIFIATYGAAIVMGAMLIGTLAYSASQKRKGEREARSAYNAAQVDRLANIAITTAPRELVLGRVRKGGNVFFKGSTGANKEKFAMLIALAGHEIDGVEQIYLNDTPVTLDAGGWVQDAPYALTSTVSTSAQNRYSFPPAGANAVPGSVSYSIIFNDYVTTWQYAATSSKVRVRAVLGTPGQAADATVMALFPGLWTAAHRAQGTAYLIVECDYDESAFPSGLPNVTARIRGAKVYDPRNGSTVWTENPALMARHVLMHPQFGKRTGRTNNEEARIIAAANACDTSHNYGAGAVPLYRAAIVFPFGTTARDALDDLTQAMGGAWAYASGEFYIRAGVYTASVLLLSDADLAVVTTGDGASQQPISISPHRSRNEKINVVTPRIWDAAQGYKHVALAPLKVAALITRDGAELVQEVDMQAVFDARQALHIAGVLMRDARDPLTVTLPFKLTAYRVEMFDTISLTLSRFGWTAKLFTVMSRTWSHDGKILLTLKETTAEIFQPDASFVVGGYANNTALPKPWEIYPPAITSITSGTSELVKQADGTIIVRVRVQWQAVTDLSITQGGSVEVQWQSPGAAGWNSIVVPGYETQAFITNANDGAPILIRLRVRNQMAVSDWGLQQSHFVIGKTAPPENVSAVTISNSQIAWTPVSDVDIAGYLLRFQYGENTWWPSAGMLHDGVITESPYTLERVPEGPCTVMVKAVDTSGNESELVAFAFFNFPTQIPSNILFSYPQHPTFPGAIINGAIFGGALKASDVDAFYLPVDGPMYLGSEDPMYLASQFAALSYVFSVSATFPGKLLLPVDIDGDYTLEYQSGGAEPMYGPAGSALYMPMDEAIYGTPSAWQLWPGSIDVDGAVEIRFRITLAAGMVRGVINSLSAVLDVPDIIEVFPTLSILSGGTRLPITKTYNAIKTVRLTVHSGGSATSVRIVDKNPTLGPLVQTINSSGTAVAGVVDAEVFGY